MIASDHCSNWNTVLSVVPKGSILEHTLFSLFVNDIPWLLGNNCLLFADDLKVFRRIGCLADTSSLQEDLDKIMSWSLTWNLFLISINKVSSLSHLRRNLLVLVIL